MLTTCHCQPTTKPKILGFYHAFIRQNHRFEAIIDEQFAKLVNSGLFDETSKLTVNFISPNDPVTLSLPFSHAPEHARKIDISFHREGFEELSINAMRRQCQQANAAGEKYKTKFFDGRPRFFFFFFFFCLHCGQRLFVLFSQQRVV